MQDRDMYKIEQQQEVIEDLLRDEQDARQRAYLLMLNSINQTLIANTEMHRNMAQKLDGHLRQFEVHLKNFEGHAQADEALLNKGRGLWIAIAWILGTAQVVVLSVWLGMTNDIQALRNSMNANEIYHAGIEQRIKDVERRLK